MGNPKKMNFKKLEVLEGNQRCIFCSTSEINELKLGPVYMYKTIITHYYCLLLSSNMQQNGRDSDGILGFLPSDIRVEIKRGKRLICSYCKKSGATLGCDITRCKIVFHLPCGIAHNSMHQFFDSFKSFCKHHRPSQKIPKDILNEASRSPTSVSCPICCENVDPRSPYDTLWAPCCKKNAWFHRECIEKLAMSAGYFFKCPLCNNKDLFCTTMREFGIYIPEQDASWEHDPNAFSDLYDRPGTCSAETCLNPSGRGYNDHGTRWEVILCRLCGSQGMHIGCGKLGWTNPIWECDECKNMLSHRYTTGNPSTPTTRTSTIVSRTPSHRRTGITSRHPSVSSDRVTEISDDDDLDQVKIKTAKRKSKVKSRISSPTPSTSHTYVISDSPSSSSCSSPIIVDDSDEEDVVIVRDEIDVPVKIELNCWRKPTIAAPTPGIGNTFYTVPAQDLYSNTFTPQTSHNFPPGATVYQSVPQDCAQGNSANQQLDTARWSRVSCHARYSDISQHWSRCSYKSNDESSSEHDHIAKSKVSRNSGTNSCTITFNSIYARPDDGTIKKFLSKNANKSVVNSLQHSKRVGDNYNRLNPIVLIPRLKIWKTEEGIFKILIPPPSVVKITKKQKHTKKLLSSLVNSRNKCNSKLEIGHNKNRKVCKIKNNTIKVKLFGGLQMGKRANISNEDKTVKSTISTNINQERTTLETYFKGTIIDLKNNAISVSEEIQMVNDFTDKVAKEINDFVITSKDNTPNCEAKCEHNLTKPSLNENLDVNDLPVIEENVKIKINKLKKCKVRSVEGKWLSKQNRSIVCKKKSVRCFKPILSQNFRTLDTFFKLIPSNTTTTSSEPDKISSSTQSIPSPLKDNAKQNEEKSPIMTCKQSLIDKYFYTNKNNISETNSKTASKNICNVKKNILKYNKKKIKIASEFLKRSKSKDIKNNNSSVGNKMTNVLDFGDMKHSTVIVKNKKLPLRKKCNKNRPSDRTRLIRQNPLTELKTDDNNFQFSNDKKIDSKFANKEDAIFENRLTHCIRQIPLTELKTECNNFQFSNEENIDSEFTNEDDALDENNKMNIISTEKISKRYENISKENVSPTKERKKALCVVI